MAGVRDHFRLGSSWLMYAGMFTAGAGVALGVIRGSFDGAGPLLAIAAALGACLGLYERYRSRFGVRAQLARALVGALLLCAVLPADLAMVAAKLLLEMPVPPVRVGLFVLFMMGIALAWGVRDAWRVVRAQAGDAAPPWLHGRADLAGGRLLDVADAQPERTRGWRLNVALLFAVVAIDLPLLFSSPDRARGWMLVLISPAMVAAFAWLARRLGQNLGYLLEIRRIERAQGHPLVTWRRDELRALRRTFWLRRLLCRSEDL